MKIFIFILILISFVQTAFLPVDLILLLLIARSYILGAKSDYILGFGFGLLLASQSGQSIGLLSLIYLILILLIHLMRKLPISNNWFILFGLAFIIIMSNEVIQLLTFKTSFNLSLIIISSLLMVPIYFGVLFWEERFIIRKDLKLKL